MISGNHAYADRAIEVLNAWPKTITEINGSDKQLAATCLSFRLVNAAEIIRYTHAGWTPAEAGISRTCSNDGRP